MAALLLAVAMGAAMTFPAGLGGQPPPPRNPCQEHSSRTLLENEEGRIILAPGMAPGSVAPVTYLCGTAEGLVVLIDLPSEDTWAYRPPAMAIAGRTVAAAVDRADEGDRAAGQTLVEFSDFRAGHLGGRRGSFLADIDGETDKAQVGSVVVAPDRAVAWIVCRYKGFAKGRRSPGCVRPGSFDRVIAVGSRSVHRKVLDEGRDIDPSSLRLTGTRLTWKRGGKRQTAKLT